MTDPDTWLDQILLSPEDRTLRLVFADWLDEHAGTVPCDVCPGTGYISELDANWHPKKFNQWLGPLDAKLRRHLCKRCGATGRLDDGRLEAAEFWRAQAHFPYEVETTLEQFLACAEFLALFPMLKWVGLTDYPRLAGDRHPLVERIWSERLTNMLLNRSFSDWEVHPQEGRNALSACCLEYLWALRPKCKFSTSLDFCFGQPTLVAAIAGKPRVFICNAHGKDTQHGSSLSIFGMHNPTLIPLPRE